MVDPRLDLGLAHHNAGRLTEAEALYRAVLAENPRQPAALHYLGLIAFQTGRPDVAATLIAAALDHGPVEATTAYNLAQARLARDDEAGAAAALRVALAAEPASAAAVEGWADALMRARRYDRAEPWYGRRRALADDSLNAVYQQGNLALDRGDGTGAIAAFAAVAARAPGHLAARAGLLEAAGLIGDFVARDEARRAIVDLLPRTAETDWRLFVKLSYLDLFDDFGEAARRVLTARLQACFPPVTPRPAPCVRLACHPLRLGYLSANLGDHPIGHVTAGLFAAHDRRRVVVHLYASRDRRDEAASFARTIAAGADRFVDISALSPVAAARRIRDDGLDLLIDLDGAMSHRGLAILGHGVAPLQLFWLGHAGVSPLPVHDATIVDALVAANDVRTLALPGCYHVASPPDAGPASTRAAEGLPADAVVFCAFNNPQKFSADLLRDWAEILRRVPDAVLWLSNPTGGPDLPRHLRAIMAGHGIDGARLVFARRVPDKGAHIARHRLADLFLDSDVMNASTTALDALWAGLPLLTLPGARFGARIAADFLTTLGLDEWIATDRTDYVARAVAWAGDAEARAAMRADLLVRRPRLFDPAAFARKLEDRLLLLVQARGSSGASASST